MRKSISKRWENKTTTYDLSLTFDTQSWMVGFYWDKVNKDFDFCIHLLCFSIFYFTYPIDDDDLPF